jgi:PAS domain S-box-containing protein
MPPEFPQIARDELLRLAIEASTGYAILATDNAGVVISWNVGAERLLGFSEGDILGNSADVIFTPEDRLAGAPEQERRLAVTCGRAEDERWHLRSDGTRFWGSGLMQPLPRGEGFMKIMRDQTARHVAEQRLQASEDRFRTLATSIPQLVFTTCPSGSRTWVSPQWIVFTGLDEARSLDFGWLDAIHPDDRGSTLAGWHQAQQSGMYEVEHRICRAAAREYRWHQTRANALQSDALGATEWVGTSTDIHELRGLKESQDVLLAELQHRTRNLLSMVQAIARRSARSSTSIEGFVSDFELRIRALSRAESLLPAAGRGTIDIRKLIDAELAAHVETSGSERIVIEGNEVGIPVASAQVVALGLHELSTNAVKHGSLHDPNGRLNISWSLVDEGSARVLHLTWRESGVAMPPESARRRKGYGTELIGRALPYQLGASTKIDFLGDGVLCEIRIPVSSDKK